MGINTVPIIFAVVCGITLLIVTLKRHCLIKGILLSTVQGVAALYAVKLAGIALGTDLAVNWYTLGTAAVLGSPGVAMTLVVQTIFR